MASSQPLFQPISVVGGGLSKWQMIEDDPSPSEAKKPLPGLPRLAGNGPARVLPTDWWWCGVGGEELLTNLNGRLKNVQNSNVLISLKAIHGFIW